MGSDGVLIFMQIHTDRDKEVASKEELFSGQWKTATSMKLLLRTGVNQK